MKLTTARVELTLHQFQGRAIPENHPFVPDLNQVFGDTPSFLRLHIVEPIVPTEDGAPAGKVMKLATRQDATLSSLAAHNPSPFPSPFDVIVEPGLDESLD